MTSPSTSRPLLARIHRTGVILALVGSAAWFITGTWNGVSALIGSSLALVNLSAMQFILSRVVAASAAGQDSGWGILMGLKFIALAFSLYLCIGPAGLAAVPFTFGIGVVVAAMIFESLRDSGLSDVAPPPAEAAPSEGV